MSLAVEYGNIDIIKLLIENGADLKNKDFNNEDPLHWAVMNGHKEVLAAIMDRSDDFFGEKERNNLLDIVMEQGYDGLIKFLKEERFNVVDPSVEDTQGVVDTDIDEQPAFIMEEQPPITDNNNENPQQVQLQEREGNNDIEELASGPKIIHTIEVSASKDSFNKIKEKFEEEGVVFSGDAGELKYLVEEGEDIQDCNLQIANTLVNNLLISVIK